MNHVRLRFPKCNSSNQTAVRFADHNLGLIILSSKLMVSMFTVVQTEDVLHHLL